MIPMNNDRIECLKKLGFEEDEIKRIIAIFPNALKLRSERLKETYENLIRNGINKENVMRYLVHTPSLFGKSINTVNRQINLYKTIFKDKYIDILNENPRRFIQGYDKTKERYIVLKNMGVKDNELDRDIFLTEKQFEKKYGQGNKK